MTFEQKHAGQDETQATTEHEKAETVRFSPEVEADLVAQSQTHKAQANGLFSSGQYDAALTKYDEAVATCPNYLDYELAVLRSNMAACQLKLEEWKDAAASATAALDGLEKLEREGAEGHGQEAGNARFADPESPVMDDHQDEPADEEIISVGAESVRAARDAEAEAGRQAERKKRDDDVARIRAKALLRRARARCELGGWSDLDGALADYKTLSAMVNLGPQDRAVVQSQLRALPPRAKAAQEKELADMWGKLKDLGNGILKPFGLSTENFQMVKDETTGGYSMNFQGAGGQGGK